MIDQACLKRLPSADSVANGGAGRQLKIERLVRVRTAFTAG
jgi:hypothetical protein